MYTRVFNILLEDLVFKFINSECQLKDNDIQYENKTIYTFKEDEIETKKISFNDKERIEISCRILGFFRRKNDVPAIAKELESCLSRVINHNNFSNMTKEITDIKESQQKTADVVNLFTEIDKKINNMEDKVNKLETKINSIESSLEQILNLLQKS